VTAGPDGASARVVVGAVGWAGHVFPALALARELRRRGHRVVLETFERWRAVAEGLGLELWAAEERMELPGIVAAGDGRSLAAVARELAEALERFEPQVVVSDLYTVAPALAAEVAGVPRASLIPHPYPGYEPGLPPYPLGLAPPRTPAGSAGWRAIGPVVGPRLPNTRLRRVRHALNRERATLGLEPYARDDGQISERLALVATFPQLEYPRAWPGSAHVTGPMPFELPHPDVELPGGSEPLVLVAASTERDPGDRLIQTALAALAREPVRVIATVNRRGSRWAGPTPGNATVVDWLSYEQAMAAASAVVCHGGHGTVARALAAGLPTVVCPPAGDMAVNGARLAWSGAGLMLPHRLLGARPLRLAVRRVLAEPSFKRRAAEIASWAQEHDGAARGADLVERLAAAG
jgi:UDP:flavonoid glycosyltransferase YjiC (YdhE family)